MIALFPCAICRGRSWLMGFAPAGRFGVGAPTIETCRFCRGRGSHAVDLDAANDDAPREVRP